MTTAETLEHFQRQAETELDAVQAQADRALHHVKELRAEVYGLRTTLNETIRAANRYRHEMSEKVRAATDSECKQKALLCKARDELERTAQELRDWALLLDVPVIVLTEHGYMVRGGNPLEIVRELQKWSLAKVKALTELGAKDER